MTETPTPPQQESPFFSSIRSLGLTRGTDRWIGGVASGVAHRFGVDPLVVRGLLLVTLFLGGLGFVLYGIAWALLPEPDGRIHLQELGRGNADVAMLGAGLFVLVGLATGDAPWSPLTWWLGGSFGWLLGVLWLCALVVVAVVVLSAVRRPGTPSASTPPQEPTMTTAAPTVPAPPAAPAAPRTLPAPAAGARYFAVCTGATLVAIAGLLLAQRTGLWSGPFVLTALGTTAVVFGAGIVVAGLLGRSSGALGLVAVLSLLLSVPAAVVADLDLGSWTRVETFDGIGSNSFTPLTLEEARGGFAVGMGDLEVDLTSLEVPVGEDLAMTLQAGMGDLVVRLPEDATVRFEATAGAGEIVWDLDGAQGETAGVGLSRSVITAPAGTDPTYDLRLNVGAGTIEIVQED